MTTAASGVPSRDPSDYYRLVAEAIPHIVWAAHADGSLVYVNRQGLEYTGGSLEELTGPGWLNLVHPDDQARTRDAWTRSLESGEPHEVEYRLRRADGEYRWQLVRGTPIKEGSGRVVRWLGTCTDIDDQRRAETTLRRVYESGMLAMGCWSADGAVTEANDAFLRLVGHSRADLEAGLVRWRDMTPPEYRDREERAFDELRASGVCAPFEKEYVLKDGTRVPILVGGATLGGEGAASGVFFALDQSERRRLEAERDELLARLRLKFDRMPLAYLRMDAALRVAAWNPAAERTFGYTAEEALGQDVIELLVPPAARPAVEAVVNRLRAGDMTAHSVNENRTKDGRVITCEWYNTPLFDPDGGFAGLLSLAQDVTEQRQIDQRIREAQKLESLGVLAGGMAHDVNNLMTPVIGHTELALKLVPNEARGEVSNHLRQVVWAAKQAAELCRQLLAYAGRGRLVVGPLDLTDLIRKADSLLRHAAGPRVDLRFSLAPGLPSVRADAGQIRQVLLNLVANAAEAIGDRPGEVEVSTSVAQLTREELARCRVGDNLPEGRYVRLEVRDTGPGMDVGVMTRAFEPFFTTKFTGRGLGLAAVLGIVQGHGGALAVDSAPQQGTTFRLYLPAAGEETLPRPASDGNIELPAWDGTVLLADDEDAVRATVGEMLRGLGFQVDAVADGREAVARVRSGQRYVLAVLDLTMRDVGGAEALASIREVIPDLPVILISGFSAEEAGERGVAAGGAVTVLPKPFRLSELTEAVRAALVSE